jgi:hypothetical protein
VTARVGQTLRLTVPLPGPVDVAASVEFLRRNGDDLLDRWDGDRLIRVLTLDGHRVPIYAERAGEVRRATGHRGDAAHIEQQIVLETCA